MLNSARLRLPLLPSVVVNMRTFQLSIFVPTFRKAPRSIYLLNANEGNRNLPNEKTAAGTISPLVLYRPFRAFSSQPVNLARSENPLYLKYMNTPSRKCLTIYEKLQQVDPAMICEGCGINKGKVIWVEDPELEEEFEELEQDSDTVRELCDKDPSLFTDEEYDDIQWRDSRPSVVCDACLSPGWE